MEKRKHDRIKLKDKGWCARLTDKVGAHPLGEVVDLSPGGMLLITAEDVAIDSLYQIECVAAGPTGEDARFSAGIMVLWRTQASQAGTWWAGLKIIDIDQASRERLLALAAAMAAGEEGLNGGSEA